jgi:hypothetical protein
MPCIYYMYIVYILYICIILYYTYYTYIYIIHILYVYDKCVKDKDVNCKCTHRQMTRLWLTKDRPGLSSERAPHRDRKTNSRPKLLKRKQYLVKRPQSGLNTKTYWLTDWLSAVKWLWLTFDFFKCNEVTFATWTNGIHFRSFSQHETFINAIPVTGRGGLQDCEMLRIPHCLDSRLKDGSKVVSFTRLPRSTLSKHYFSASGTLFC